MASFYLKKGDLLPALQVTLKDQDGNIEDLTPASGVNFRFSLPDGTKLDRAATIADAVNGRVSYTWQSGDTAYVGEIEGEFVATIGGKPKTFPSADYVDIVITENKA